MEEEMKKRIAQFRFGVIHDFIGDRKLNRGEKERLLQEKSTYIWDIPFSGRSYISRSTLLRWIRHYKKEGGRLEALYPENRSDIGKSRVLDKEAILSFINLKKELKGASVPTLLKIAQQRKIMHRASQNTIYRLLKREGLLDNEISYPDRRRYEAELPNGIWQSDCMHGPKVEDKGRLRKSYLFSFIDDMSRLIPQAEFYLHERLDSYTDALMKAFQKRGLPRKLYVDNGPTFRSNHLEYIAASLGVALIHSKPYQPEGRGKIERWFKTLQMQFLTTIPDGLSLDELNKQLQQWIDNHYHLKLHSSTNEPPLKRYLKHVHLVRQAPKDIRDYFRIRVKRKVDKDRVVSLNNKVYEAPIGLIGKKIFLLYHQDDPNRIEVFYNNASYGLLIPLDIKINSRIRRHQNITELEPLPEENRQIENYYQGGKLFDKGENHD